MISSGFQDSISFTIFSISIFGFFLLTIYTVRRWNSFVFTRFQFVKGLRNDRFTHFVYSWKTWRSCSTRSDWTTTSTNSKWNRCVEEKISSNSDDAITWKTTSRFVRTTFLFSSKSFRLFFNLVELEGKESALSRNESSIRVVRRSLFFKCRFLYRPLQIVSGVLLLLLALLIFISLLLSDINKSIHFVSFRQIFAHGNNSLPNPIDIILTWTGQVRKTFQFQWKRKTKSLRTFLFSFIQRITSFSVLFFCMWFSLRFLDFNNWAFGIFGFE